MNGTPRERQAVIALHLMDGFGPRAFRGALDTLGSAAAVFSAPDRDLAACGVKRPTAERLRAVDPAASAEAEERRAAELGLRLLTWADEGYPALLREIHDPPPVLYMRGVLDPASAPAVAVVGTRKATPYGLSVAGRIGRDLAAAGITVVSGLARGIDAAAHAGVLAAGGKTVAVLGEGCDRPAPADRAGLYADIAARGLVLSEFPPGTRADRHTFPRRNRIVSGLTLATIVVEAGGKSGALITADFALQQGRDVYAVPGPAGSEQSAGCHKLLRDGARLYERPDDLLETLAPWAGDQPAAGPATRLLENLPADEAAALGAFHGLPLFLDEVVAGTGLSAQRASAALLALEMKGLVTRHPGNRYMTAEEVA